ncbi:MAG: MFS transporter [Agriterribacter sp.]
MTTLRRNQVQVAATGFFSLFSLIGILFYGMSFFYDFWVKEFGWSRTVVTSGNALGRVVVALFAFVAGWLIEKYGPRKMIITGVLLGGLAFVGFGIMTSRWQFYTFSLMAAMGYICGGPLPNQVLTSRWFNKSRGKAMSIAYLGVGVGGMLVPQIAKWLNLHFGWHHAMMLLGVLMLVISLPATFFVKDNPEEAFSGKDATVVKGAASTIFKNRSFYLLALGSMCSIAAVSGTSQNLKLFFSLDLKFTQEQSANILSLVLFSSIIGRLFMGWMADRLSKKWVMLLIYFLVAAAIPLLYYAASPGVIYVFAFVFGVALGGDYMIIPLMTAELFGVKSLGLVMGFILTSDVIADATAPMLVGWIRDSTGSYLTAFAWLIVLAMVGFIAIAFLPRKSNAQ